MGGKKQKRRIWPILLAFPLLLLAIFLYYLISSLFLTVTYYQLEANVTEPIRVVHLSDLHNAEFGKNNSRLVHLVAEQEPDLIFMSGDMLNEDDSNTDVVTELIKKLSSVAPVYYGYGNHEKTWEKTFGKDLREIMGSAGATVVDNDYIDLEVNGNALRISGYMGWYGVPLLEDRSKERYKTEIEYMLGFQDTDRLKLLINHVPLQWVDWNYVDRYPVDFVFSGHYHGGVIRIPILDRGLYAPYVGWFPPFTKGVYSGSMATCVLSAGLGVERRGIPRLNNPPEIVVVDLAQADAA